MTVPFGATTVDATMWTTAYNCPNGFPITGSEIFNLAAAPGGQVPISFPYGNTIYRGDSNPGQFTDPPGSLRVSLDVTGKPTGCYDVAYSGTYRDTSGDGASNTYFTQVCITREPQPENPPKGNVEVNDCNTISGWAYSPDDVSANVIVQIFRDGQVIYSQPTDQDRPDLPGWVPGGPTKHGFIKDMTPYKDAYSHSIVVTAMYLNDHTRSVLLDSRTVGPCVNAICSISTPGTPGVGEPFDITLSYSFDTTYGAFGRPVSPTGTVRFNGGPPQSYNFPAYPGGSTSHTFTGFKQNSPGQFSESGNVSQPGAFSVNCGNNNTDVAAKPYVKVYGNDVASGGAFADSGPTTCSKNPTLTTPPAAQWAFSKQVNNFYGGASTQFASFALGQNDGFFSAGSRNGVAAGPNPAIGLSFGNMINNSLVTNFGGESGLSRCIPDYYSASSQPGATVLSTGVVNPGPINNGTHTAIFVNGDAYITSNIKHANTTWNNVSDIPSFYLIVKGNIYIDREVTDLDGIYIAQPDPTNPNTGRIYTCTNGSNLIANNDLFANCQNKLTITGAFIAKQVRYQRTRGTVNSSIPDASPSGPYTPTNEDANSGNIAEVFNFSQEMYLAPQPAILDSVIGGGAGPKGYDAITSLPPIL